MKISRKLTPEQVEAVASQKQAALAFPASPGFRELERVWTSAEIKAHVKKRLKGLKERQTARERLRKFAPRSRPIK